MISRVQRIKSFGVFSDFEWPANLHEFKKFNLFYGWNYSGKTTLSRTFRCFEQGTGHADYANAEVQLKIGDGTLHDISSVSHAHTFRVFNRDFVNENIGFDSCDASAIPILGDEDIANQKTLNDKRVERKNVFDLRLGHTALKEAMEQALGKSLTTAARDSIKNPLSIPSYDKTNFEPKVAACGVDSDKFVCVDPSLETLTTIYLSRDKKAALPIVKTEFQTSLRTLEANAAALLSRRVTASAPIARLIAEPNIERWVNQGRALHVGKSTCQFCGEPLPADLLAHLTVHFSADYDNLMGELKQLIAQVKAAQLETIEVPHESAFYSAWSAVFVEYRDALTALTDSRKAALGVLLSALENKQTAAFSQLASPVIEDSTDQVALAVAEINKVIALHNGRTAQFEFKRTEAFHKIEMHHAALFASDEDYVGTQRQIAAHEKAVTDLALQLEALDAEILRLQASFSGTANGAEQLNVLLQQYFGKRDLRIDVTADNRFQISRGDGPAKNLSEGEKTAIAFAHFVTRVMDGNTPLADTTVIVDDPISSLDANHLFNTFAVIKTQLKNCHQLFVLTHNFDFFNLFKEWAEYCEGKDRWRKKPQENWRFWSIYLVRCTDPGTSVLEVIPRELLRFRSEYHYLFAKIYRFDRRVGPDFDELLSLPNVVRRFMEAFSAMMIPVAGDLWNGKADRIFKNEVERERVLKFINTYSHQQTITRSLTIPDTSECEAIVKLCLEAVRIWNAKYFEDMESEVV